MIHTEAIHAEMSGRNNGVMLCTCLHTGGQSRE
jgi:hypothetical protein